MRFLNRIKEIQYFEKEYRAPHSNLLILYGRRTGQMRLNPLGVLDIKEAFLHTIAEGERKIGKIASKLRLPSNNLTKYLEILMDLDIVQREVPVTEEQPQKPV